MAKLLHRPIDPVHQVAAHRPRFAAIHAECATDASIGQDTGGHRLQKTQPAYAAVTTLPAAGTA